MLARFMRLNRKSILFVKIQLKRFPEANEFALSGYTGKLDFLIFLINFETLIWIENLTLSFMASSIFLLFVFSLKNKLNAHTTYRRPV